MKMDGDKKIKAQSFNFFSVSAAGQVGSGVQHPHRCSGSTDKGSPVMTG